MRWGVTSGAQASLAWIKKMAGPYCKDFLKNEAVNRQNGQWQ